MRNHSERQLLALLAIVFGLIHQCASIAVYKCDNETTVCGCSKRPDAVLEITEGQSALQNNWDWVVSLRALNYHLCGGAILNEWYIITAAHCLEYSPFITSRMTVCAGTLRLSDPCHESRTIHSIIFHPLYKNNTSENDIALVRLTTPFNLSDSSLTSICLPSVDRDNEYPEVDTQVVSFGWGNTKPNETSHQPEEVILKVMDKSSIHCNHLTNHRVQLCAGGSEKNISKGDSGGPLMSLKASKQWELIGLTSFLHNNATPQTGIAFTLIAPFIQFIQTHIYKSLTHPTMINCSCQCPHGSDSGYVYSTVNYLDGCVNACMAVLSNPCTSSNTYACLEENCTYSNSYNHQPSLST